MKIKDLILEEVDMGWLRKLDSMLNPEAFDSATKEEARCKELCSSTDGTPVFIKPSSKQIPHSTKPQEGETRSPGYRGLVNVHLKSNHISRKRAEKLANP